MILIIPNAAKMIFYSWTKKVKKHGTTKKIAVKLILLVDVYSGKNAFQKFYSETKSAGW